MMLTVSMTVSHLYQNLKIILLCHIVELPSSPPVFYDVFLLLLFYFIYLFIFALSGSSPVLIVNVISAFVAIYKTFIYNLGLVKAYRDK